jgi:hypothetical protein
MCDDIPKIHHGGDTPNMGDGLGDQLIHAPLFGGMPITLRAFNLAQK